MRFIVTPNPNPGGSSVYVVDTEGVYPPTWRANADEAERYADDLNHADAGPSGCMIPGCDCSDEDDWRD